MVNFREFVMIARVSCVDLDFLAGRIILKLAPLALN